METRYARPLLALVRVPLLALTAFACGDEPGAEASNGAAESAQRCDNMRDQIMKALEDNVSAGVLVGTAVPCGPDGVAQRRDYFDSRVQPESVNSLQSAFANACAEYESNCPQ